MINNAPAKSAVRALELAEIEYLLPGVIDWAKDVYERGVDAGNPPGNVYRNILHVELPRHLRERGFDEVRRRLPAYSREAFNGQVEQFIAAGASLADAVSAVLHQVERAVAERAAAVPSTIAPVAQIVGRKREVADEAKFLRIQEAELRQLHEGKNRTRTHITMDQQSPSNFEARPSRHVSCAI